MTLSDAIKEFREEMARFKDIPVHPAPTDGQNRDNGIIYTAPYSSYGKKLQELIKNLEARGIPRDVIEENFRALSFSPYNEEKIPEQIKREMISRMEILIERLDYLEQVYRELEQNRLSHPESPLPQTPSAEQDQEEWLDQGRRHNLNPRTFTPKPGM